jgi:hypothetical protein
LKHGGIVRRTQFSPDGRSVLTACEDRFARLWILPKIDRPVADLLQMASVLSGQQIDRTGHLEPLPPEHLLDAWRRWRAKYPEDFPRPPPAK